MSCLTSRGQGRELVDSLINANCFPLLPAFAAPVSQYPDIGALRPLYAYYLGGEGGDTIRYFLRPDEIKALSAGDTLYPVGQSALCSVNDRGVFFLPRVHVAFFYARTFRRKSEKYRHINFFVDYFFKNYGDSAWMTSDHRIRMKLFDGDDLLKVWNWGRTHRGGHREGWLLTGQNQINAVLDIENWSHYNPKRYRYSFEVFYGEAEPHEQFEESIGFRDVRLEKGSLLINNEPLRFKCAAIDPGALALGRSAGDYLRMIKANNFNSILLKGKGTKEIFDFCDLAGLNVVQEINDDAFGSLAELLQYFTCFKEHPSLVAWSNAESNRSWIGVLERLDHGRPVLRGAQQVNPVIEHWDKLDSTERMKIRNAFQTFRFYYLSDSSALKVSLDEAFPCLDILDLRWRITEGGAMTDQGQIRNIEWHNDAAEIRLDTDAGKDKASEPSFEFELVVNEDYFPYKKGDIIALGKFSYVIQEGRPIYRADY